ncbi:myogenesis-regulating glycosidase-like [Asterias rubens]|uniref:myogenesis-regulating glycosidase-like n=1 Tax=Asterias rubens TaxID=7604 RepID=UPI0014550A2F|nr:myogenesis-regulating glycosidase-like [Asterias rubens]
MSSGAVSKRRIALAACLILLVGSIAIAIISGVLVSVRNQGVSETIPAQLDDELEQTPTLELVQLDATSRGIAVKNRDGIDVLRGTLAVNTPSEVRGVDCSAGEGGNSLCYRWKNVAELDVRVVAENGKFSCIHMAWETLAADTPLRDCYRLDGAHWYGSAGMFRQRWPIEKWNQTTQMYASGDVYENWQYYGSVLDRYWLSSKGVAIRVSHDSPLHVSLNDNDDGMVCFQSTYDNSFYPNFEGNLHRLDYTICTHDNVRLVHDGIWREIGIGGGKLIIPSGIPDNRMIRSPIWSTWVRFKISINDSVVMAFADEIVANGFGNSQLEIDDGYNLKYGELNFDPERFPNMQDTVTKLHAKGFRVTLWVHPFANTDTDVYQDGKEKGYWVTKRGQDEGVTEWWNGKGGLLDVTNPAAVDWFMARLEQLQRDTGIDSFKFDAGETNFLVKDFETYIPLVNPCEYTTLYAKMAARLGSQVEVRAAYENQDLPIFVRMMDKDSRWGWDNGLKTLITSALTFGIIGYPYVLPDMIGGNSYESGFHGNTLPDRELFIRWLEITAFMPAMQFSISPWQYDQEIVTISRKWVSFHENFITPILLKTARTETTVAPGQPLIRPVWWIAPTDEESLQIDTEFLVGNDLLVAPILDNETYVRDVYLPPVDGVWTRMPQGDAVQGGQWLRNVPVPLDEVLYFILDPGNSQ